MTEEFLSIENIRRGDKLIVCNDGVPVSVGRFRRQTDTLIVLVGGSSFSRRTGKERGGKRTLRVWSEADEATVKANQEAMAEAYEREECEREERARAKLQADRLANPHKYLVNSVRMESDLADRWDKLTLEQLQQIEQWLAQHEHKKSCCCSEC